MCKFGQITVRARFISSRSIKCIAPSTIAAIAAPVHLSVSNDGSIFVKADVMYVYKPPIFLDYASPPILLTGRMTQVSIIGYFDVPASAHLECDFGVCGAARGYIDPSVSTQVICDPPPNRTDGTVFLKVIDMSTNVHSNQITMFFVSEPVLLSVDPPFGDESGSDAISIYGEGFTSGVDVKCLFDGVEAPGAGLLISSSLIKCYTPPHEPGNVSLAVSYHGVTVTDTSLSFEFIDKPTILDMQPHHGPAKGGTSIRLQLSNVRNTNTLSCKIGSTVSRAVWISQGIIACTSPPQSTTSTVDVKVSYNQKIFPSEGIDFLYTPDIKLERARPNLAFREKACILLEKASAIRRRFFAG